MDKKNEILDFTEIFDLYKGKWVALTKTENKVVGSGISPQEALEESLKKGVKEPVFLKIPSDYTNFIL